MLNDPQKRELEQIKQGISIIDLAKELGLEVKGRQARCYNSQNHKNNDQHFSLGFDTQTNRFKCFACNVSGSVIDLYQQVKGVELKDAIKDLKNKIGLNSSNMTQTAKTIAKTPKKEAQGQINAICGYLEQLCKGLDKQCLDYLKSNNRGLTDQTIKRFRLFSIKDYKKTDEDLKKKFSLDDLKDAGLLSDSNNLLFYKHKLIIPFLKDGQIIFLQGRRVDDEQPKYLHIKRPVPLFNIDILKTLDKGQKVYICEGVFDAMILEQNGYNAVAVLGVNNFKPEMTSLFKNLDVVLCFDNDEAGDRAMQEVARQFYFTGKQVKSKQLPEGIKDLTDYFTK
jgi:DNA primase